MKLHFAITTFCILAALVSAASSSDVNNSSKCNAESTTYNQIATSVLVPFIPVTILGNALVIFVAPNLYKQRLYMFITSLAVADGLVGAVSMVIKARLQIDFPYFCLQEYVCWIFTLAEITFSLASVMNLFAIAMFKYISLKYTYEATSIVSRRRIIHVISAIWIFSLSCSFIGVFKWNNPNTVSIDANLLCIHNNPEYFTFIYITFLIIPTTTMVYFYHDIYQTTASHIRAISLTTPDSKQGKKRFQRQKHFRLIRSLVIVFAAHTICWIPTVLFIMLSFYAKSILKDVVYNKGWFPIVYFILIQFLPHFNSTLNPFVYVIGNAEFRNIAYLKIFGRKRCDRESLVRNTTTILKLH